MDKIVPVRYSADETFDIGMDTGSPVSPNSQNGHRRRVDRANSGRWLRGFFGRLSCQWALTGSSGLDQAARKMHTHLSRDAYGPALYQPLWFAPIIFGQQGGLPHFSALVRLPYLESPALEHQIEDGAAVRTATRGHQYFFDRWL